jgi:3-isopropylmalate dehydrogenase
MRRIGIMGGDGIGPELVAEAVRALEAVAGLVGFAYELVEYPHSGAHYRRVGAHISDAEIDALASLDALLFGAGGDPSLPPGTIERGLLMRIVDRLDLGIGVRPAKLCCTALTPLKDRGPGDVDLVIVRDTTEDCFVAPGGVVRAGTANEVSLGLLVYTRLAVERTTRHAFGLARARRGRVTLVDQANALPAHAIWRRVADEIAAEFPDVELDHAHPDVAAMRLITDPGAFDVILTTFFVGGILSDEAAALIGGVGAMGSARIGSPGPVGIFEPAHGAAPKYAGTGRASPVGTLRALAMLLAHVDEADAAGLLDGAIDTALASGRLPNVSARGPLGTRAATDAVLASLEGVAV